MRHGISGNRIGRNGSWRKATIRDLARATLRHQRICTTEARAKEARKLVDRLITLAKTGNLAARRQAFAVLCDHRMVADLFDKTAPLFRNRCGGYTRIIPYTFRRGDKARMVFLELTEKDERAVTRSKGRAPAVKPPPKTEGTAGASPEPGEDVSAAPKERKLVGGFKKLFRRKPAE